nr:MAG TPA: hypothetical protein [Bacteriophage sp.]
MEYTRLIEDFKESIFKRLFLQKCIYNYKFAGLFKSDKLRKELNISQDLGKYYF